ncbi:hypothetical protein BRY73_16195 [Ochrobactrum sp. P6BS-III]|nr:hypothetical protein BRY73_16195 [Ochrobactrum sp. P6BS-III]
MESNCGEARHEALLSALKGIRIARSGGGLWYTRCGSIPKEELRPLDRLILENDEITLCNGCQHLELQPKNKKPVAVGGVHNGLIGKARLGGGVPRLWSSFWEEDETERGVNRSTPHALQG